MELVKYPSEEKWKTFSPSRIVDKLGATLPFARVREYYAELADRLLNIQTSVVPAASVERLFVEIETILGRTPDPITIKTIRFHQSFIECLLTPANILNVIWYFDPTPTHISYFLTSGGRDRNLHDVANNYLHGNFPSEKVDHWREGDLQNMLGRYRSGEQLPPVILSRRPKGMRPDGNLHIIDGVHRLLALTVHSLETNTEVRQKAFIA